MLAAALLPLGAAAPSARADTGAATRTLCVDMVALRDSPSGYAVGYLHRPQRLYVLTDSTNHRWVLVRAARGGLTGWILRGALCPAGRR